MPDNALQPSLHHMQSSAHLRKEGRYVQVSWTEIVWRMAPPFSLCVFSTLPTNVVHISSQPSPPHFVPAVVGLARSRNSLIKDPPAHSKQSFRHFYLFDSTFSFRRACRPPSPTLPCCHPMRWCVGRTTPPSYWGIPLFLSSCFAVSLLPAPLPPLQPPLSALCH